MDRFIDDVVATVDAVAARKHRRRRLGLSFDEWNVWYQSRVRRTDQHRGQTSSGPPPIEDVYSKPRRRGRRRPAGQPASTTPTGCRVACQAQLVNVIAPIMTEPGGEAWRQSIFFPVATTFGTARGNSLEVAVTAPVEDTELHDDVPSVAAAATHDPETGQLALFVTHRGGAATDVVVDHRGFGDWQVRSAQVIEADDKGQLYGAEAAAAARPVPLEGVRTEAGTTALRMPAESWAAVVVDTTGGASS